MAPRSSRLTTRSYSPSVGPLLICVAVRSAAAARSSAHSLSNVIQIPRSPPTNCPTDRPLHDMRAFTGLLTGRLVSPFVRGRHPRRPRRHSGTTALTEQVHSNETGPHAALDGH